MNRVFETPHGTELPILNLKGKDYLEVKYRLVWFREEHPAWSIETEFTAVSDRAAVAKATIRDDEGRVIATSHKQESANHFPDFMEKAETGAIGRALALIGFGTQFCADELDEGERIVDAPARPVKVAKPNQTREQIMAENGFKEPAIWTFPFGSFKGKSLEQVHREKGVPALQNARRLILENIANNEPYKNSSIEEMQGVVGLIEQYLDSLPESEFEQFKQATAKPKAQNQFVYPDDDGGGSDYDGPMYGGKGGE